MENQARRGEGGDEAKFGAVEKGGEFEEAEDEARLASRMRGIRAGGRQLKRCQLSNSIPDIFRGRRR